MLLTLIALRHAKAEASRGDDFSRELTGRGETDASRAGAFLAEHRLVPDLALVSDARRTARTAELVAQRSASVATRLERVLYNAELPQLKERLGRVDAADRTVLLVAHNPGVMDLAVDLARDGDHAEMARLAGRFPPGALAVIAFEAEDWRDACASGGRLDALVFPEDGVRED